MNENPLNALAAVAMQQLAELLAIVPRKSLAASPTLSKGQQRRAAFLVSRLLDASESVRTLFSRRIQAAGFHMDPIGESHRHFLLDELIPAEGDLAALYVWLAEQGEVEISLPEVRDSEPSEVARYLEFAVERCEGMAEFFGDRGFDERVHDAATRLLRSHLMRPEEWLFRLQDVAPLMTERKQKIPYHVRLRFDEINRSYVYGQWIAVLSVSRSLVEYALIHRSQSLGFDPCAPGGRDRFLGVSELIERASPALPTVGRELASLVRTANSVLHPKRGDELITLPAVMRSEARKAVDVVRRMLEALYS